MLPPLPCQTSGSTSQSQTRSTVLLGRHGKGYRRRAGCPAHVEQLPCPAHAHVELTDDAVMPALLPVLPPGTAQVGEQIDDISLTALDTVDGADDHAWTLPQR